MPTMYVAELNPYITILAYSINDVAFDNNHAVVDRSSDPVKREVSASIIRNILVQGGVSVLMEKEGE